MGISGGKILQAEEKASVKPWTVWLEWTERREKVVGDVEPGHVSQHKQA